MPFSQRSGVDARVLAPSPGDYKSPPDPLYIQDLQTINLSKTTVTDLTPLSALTSLRYLYVTGSKVTDTSVLAHLPDLKIISLPKRPLSNPRPA